MIKIVVICVIVALVAIIIYYVLRSQKKSTIAGCDPECLSNQECSNGTCVDKTCPPCGADQICDPNNFKCIYPCGPRPSSVSNEGECTVEQLTCSANGEWVCPGVCGPFPNNSGKCSSFKDLTCDTDTKKWICTKACNGNGIDRLDGKGCVCGDGYYGPNCEYKKPECSGRGSWNGQECVCDNDPCGNPYTGTMCTDGCDNKCNSKGVWNGSSCKCNDGWSGDDCSISSSKCNSGNLQNDGTCECDPGYLEPNCLHNQNECKTGTASIDLSGNLVCTCPEDYYGNRCQFSKEANCNNNGTPIISSDGSSIEGCTCEPGYGGDTCQCSNESSCNGNGDINVVNGVCECKCKTDSSGNPLYTGDKCQCDLSKKDQTQCDFCSLTTQSCDSDCKGDNCWKCSSSNVCPDPEDMLANCLAKCDDKTFPQCNIVGGVATFSCVDRCANPNLSDAQKCLDSYDPDTNRVSYMCNEETKWQWSCNTITTGGNDPECSEINGIKPTCLELNYVNGEYVYNTNTTDAVCINYPNYCQPGDTNSECGSPNNPNYVSQWICPGEELPFGKVVSDNNLNPSPVVIPNNNGGQSQIWMSADVNPLPVYPTVLNSQCDGSGLCNKVLERQTDYNVLYKNVVQPKGNILGSQGSYTFVPYDTTRYIYYDKENDNPNF